MFSGLIEAIGRIDGLETIPRGVRISVSSDLVGELALGDSIAVNGVCLTVVARSPTRFEAEISPETARVTTLGGLAIGALVNLERPLRADARLGGHFVLGHVDGVGRVSGVVRQAEFSLVTIGYEPEVEPYLVPKGSVAVDGISLTIAGLRAGAFDVQIVPFTWDHTNLQAAHVDDAVNLECDIIGKYVVKTVRETTGGE